MNKKYFDLVNEGGDGYRPAVVEKDSRSIAEKIQCLEGDLADAELDGLTYKAKKIREQIANLKAGA